MGTLIIAAGSEDRYLMARAHGTSVTSWGDLEKALATADVVVVDMQDVSARRIPAGTHVLYSAAANKKYPPDFPDRMQLEERRRVADEQERARVESGEQPSRWMPEPNVPFHQAVGKLGEEVSELATICFRIMIQGVAGSDPKSGVPNAQHLAEEMDDVTALMEVVAQVMWQVLLTPLPRSAERVARKIRMKLKWMDLLQAPAEGE